MSDANSLLIKVYAQTDVGRVRAGNEDTFLVLDLNSANAWTPVTYKDEPPPELQAFAAGHYGSILAVSDGMGGALAGEVASRMAVEGVRNHMLQFQASAAYSTYPFHERLRLAVEQANTHINNESIGNSDYAGMGATFTAAGIHQNQLILAQIGDSRCYLIRDGQIHLMTHDQSLVWQLVEAGHITEEEAETHQYKNVILQALGAQPRVNVVVDRIALHNGDRILLCSDGLSGRMSAREMYDIVNGSGSLREACSALIDLANDRGGEDNITVVLAEFSGDQLPPPGDVETERVERDPELPYDLDHDLLADSEPTLSPDRDADTADLPAQDQTAPLGTAMPTARFGAAAVTSELTGDDLLAGGTEPLSPAAVIGLSEEGTAELRPPPIPPPPPAPPVMRPAHAAAKTGKRGGGIVRALAVLVMLGVGGIATWMLVTNRGLGFGSPASTTPSPTPPGHIDTGQAPADPTSPADTLRQRVERASEKLAAIESLADGLTGTQKSDYARDHDLIAKQIAELETVLAGLPDAAALEQAAERCGHVEESLNRLEERVSVPAPHAPAQTPNPLSEGREG